MRWHDNGSADITGGSESTQVGRITNLRVTDNSGAALAGVPIIAWAIPGTIIHNFTVGPAPTYVENLDKNVDLVDPATSFVWEDGGAHEVQVSLMFPLSSPIGLTSTFNVEAPTVTGGVTLEDIVNNKTSKTTLIRLDLAKRE